MNFSQNSWDFVNKFKNLTQNKKIKTVFNEEKKNQPQCHRFLKLEPKKKCKHYVIRSDGFFE